MDNPYCSCKPTRTWRVTSTPEGCQTAPVVLGGEPEPEPAGHHPQEEVDQHARP